MVGAPKHLSDLAQIDAHLAVRCRSCGRRRVYDRVMLAADLHERRANGAWSELARALPCRCGSTSLSLAPMPYAAQVTDPDLRPYERGLIRMAIGVLDRADRRAGDAAIATVEVRLALHVLRPWVTQKHLLTFWQMAGYTDRRQRSRGIRLVSSAIVRELRMMGRLDADQAANDAG